MSSSTPRPPCSSNSAPRKTDPPGLSPLQHLPMSERQHVSRQSNWRASTSTNQIRNVLKPIQNGLNIHQRENGAGEAYTGVVVSGKPSPKTTRKSATAKTDVLKGKAEKGRAIADQKNEAKKSIPPKSSPSTVHASCTGASVTPPKKAPRNTRARSPVETHVYVTEEELFHMKGLGFDDDSLAQDNILFGSYSEEAPAHFANNN